MSECTIPVNSQEQTAKDYDKNGHQIVTREMAEIIAGEMGSPSLITKSKSHLML